VGISKANGQRVAIKTIPKAKVSRPETMRREINILRVRFVSMSWWCDRGMSI
jgi:hypothetical protein